MRGKADRAAIRIETRVRWQCARQQASQEQVAERAACAGLGRIGQDGLALRAIGGSVADGRDTQLHPSIALAACFGRSRTVE
jgi:hypothetical protein